MKIKSRELRVSILAAIFSLLFAYQLYDYTTSKYSSNICLIGLIHYFSNFRQRGQLIWVTWAWKSLRVKSLDRRGLRKSKEDVQPARQPRELESLWQDSCSVEVPQAYTLPRTVHSLQPGLWPARWPQRVNRLAPWFYDHLLHWFRIHSISAGEQGAKAWHSRRYGPRNHVLHRWDLAFTGCRRIY